MKSLLVSVLYYDENSTEIEKHTGEYLVSSSERVILPDSFRRNKSIIAICEGDIVLLNKLGSRFEFS